MGPINHMKLLEKNFLPGEMHGQTCLSQNECGMFKSKQKTKSVSTGNKGKEMKPEIEESD